MANTTDVLQGGMDSPSKLGDQDTFATSRQFSLSDLRGVMQHEISNTSGLEEFPRADDLLADLRGEESNPRENRHSDEVKNDQPEEQKPEPPPPPPLSEEERAYRILQLITDRLRTIANQR